MTDEPKVHMRVRIGEAWDRLMDFMRKPHPPGTPWWRRTGVSALRILRGVIADLLDGQLTLRAMSLVYTTLLSLVPLLAISFSVLKGFGVHNQIEPFLLNVLAPLGEEKSQEITAQIIGFVDNTEVGVLGFVGLGVLFYFVITLMQKIESAFNYVWHTSEERNWVQRVRDYLSIIIIGPTLIFGSLGAMAAIMSSPAVESISSIRPFGWLLEGLSRVGSTFLVVAAFTFIYAFIPNTPVRLRSAFLGALIAGILWVIMGWYFAAFIASTSSYITIYAGFATPILFMVWLYFSWLVLLIGVSIAFYDQHPEYALKGRRPVELSLRMTEKLSLLIARAVGRTFYGSRDPLGIGDLSRELNISAPAVEKVVGTLESSGFLRRSDDDPPCFLPGRPWESSTAADLIEGVRRISGWDPSMPELVRSDPWTDEVFESSERAQLDALREISLKELSLAGTSESDLARRAVSESRAVPAR